MSDSFRSAAMGSRRVSTTLRHRPLSLTYQRLGVRPTNRPLRYAFVRSRRVHPRSNCLLRTCRRARPLATQHRKGIGHPLRGDRILVVASITDECPAGPYGRRKKPPDRRRPGTSRRGLQHGHARQRLLLPISCSPLLASSVSISICSLVYRSTRVEAPYTPVEQATAQAGIQTLRSIT